MNRQKKMLKVAAVMMAAALTVTAAPAAAYAADSTVTAQAAPGSQSASVTASGATEITTSTTETGKTYESTTASQNAVLVNGDITENLKNSTVTKSGDSSGGDSDNFYGTNSAILAEGGATLNISGATISATANGANGVFSYGGNGGTNGASGDGTTVNISDSTITTTGNNAGGIMTTGGGVTNASDLTITTSGNSSAPIRTDRGGGTVTVDGGTYTSKGVGSPAIYSTADISVKNAALIAQVSEGVVVEGMNSVDLTNCTLTVSNTQKNSQSTTYQAVMLYQSMSGDAANGNSEFTMTGGTLTNENGSIFYVTNTVSTINLNGATIINNDADNVLLKAAAGAWGSSGSNGGSVTMNAAGQTLDGNIVVDEVSALNLLLTEKSTFTGAINTSGQAGDVYVSVPSGCTWKLTADSYITSLTCADGSIDLNGHTLYVNGTAYTSGASTGEEVSATIGGGNGGSGMPSMPGSGSSDGSQQTPPAMPGSDSTDGSNQPPTPPTNADGTTTPPAMPGSSDSTDGSNQPPTPPTNADGTTTPPAMPGSDSTDGSNQPPTPPTEQVTTETETATTEKAAAPTVKKAWNKAGSKLKVTWEKEEDADGYQVRLIWTDEDGNTQKKTYTIKNGDTTKKVIKNLTAGTTYKVRVRSYQLVDGKRVYSKWSKAKTVTINK